MDSGCGRLVLQEGVGLQAPGAGDVGVGDGGNEAAPGQAEVLAIFRGQGCAGGLEGGVGRGAGVLAVEAGHGQVSWSAP